MLQLLRSLASLDSKESAGQWAGPAAVMKAVLQVVWDAFYARYNSGTGGIVLMGIPLIGQVRCARGCCMLLVHAINTHSSSPMPAQQSSACTQQGGAHGLHASYFFTSWQLHFMAAQQAGAHVQQTDATAMP